MLLHGEKENMGRRRRRLIIFSMNDDDGRCRQIIIFHQFLTGTADTFII